MTTPNTQPEQEINNGGPAFPTHENVNDPRSDGFLSTPGMSLRDWFAGQALAGLVSRHTDDVDDILASVIVDEALLIAGAMLAARKAGAK
jgi:hypothetical protein